MDNAEDRTLYATVKKEADAKFIAKTSIYKSSWIVREYKKRGGTFVGSKQNDKGLSRWFREKWVDLNRPGQPCGRSHAKLPQKQTVKSKTRDLYPLCRPTVKVTNETPRLAKDIDRKDLARAKKEKQIIQHHGRIKFGKERRNSHLAT